MINDKPIHMIQLVSDLRVYLVTLGSQKICKIQVTDGIVTGVFIDGAIEPKLRGHIGAWSIQNKLVCPDKIPVLGTLTAVNQPWMAASE